MPLLREVLRAGRWIRTIPRGRRKRAIRLRSIAKESEIGSNHTRKPWNKSKLISPGYEEASSGSAFSLEFNLDRFADVSVPRRNEGPSGEKVDVVADA